VGPNGRNEYLFGISQRVSLCWPSRLSINNDVMLSGQPLDVTAQCCNIHGSARFLFR
jgi:hypothetical protein